MTTTRRSFLAACVSTPVAGVLAQSSDLQSVLPSWNDCPAKTALLDYVAQVTRPGASSFIPVAERIAVFDNDGTLWPENPVPFQVVFALDRLKAMVASRPSLTDDPIVQAALKGDVAILLKDHSKGLLHVLALTHAGLTTEEFDAAVRDWVRAARHPRFQRRFIECVYQPMLEVLAYLRGQGFRTFIVSGGGADFMRVWSEPVYGIPPEQVVGSHGRVKFEFRNQVPVLIKTLDHVFVDDKEGKPEGIHTFIGRRPVLCVGNSDGDQAMLEYTTIGNPYRSLGLIVHHTDAEREYAYDAAPQSSGKLVEALKEAPRRGWLLIDMKRDWKEIFPPAKAK